MVHRSWVNFTWLVLAMEATYGEMTGQVTFNEPWISWGFITSTVPLQGEEDQTFWGCFIDPGVGHPWSSLPLRAKDGQLDLETMKQGMGFVPQAGCCDMDILRWDMPWDMPSDMQGICHRICNGALFEKKQWCGCRYPQV